MQMLSFLGSKKTNLSLEIEPHRKQPEGIRLLFFYLSAMDTHEKERVPAQ